MLRAGIVDEDIDMTERRDRGIDQLHGIGGAAQVRIDRDRPHAVFGFQRGTKPLGLGGIAEPVDDDRGLFACQRLRDRPPDAAGRTGHDRHSPRQCHFSGPPLLCSSRLFDRLIERHACGHGQDGWRRPPRLLHCKKIGKRTGS
jgi:hypothetical protein